MELLLYRSISWSRVWLCFSAGVRLCLGSHVLCVSFSWWVFMCCWCGSVLSPLLPHQPSSPCSPFDEVSSKIAGILLVKEDWMRGPVTLALHLFIPQSQDLKGCSPCTPSSPLSLPYAASWEHSTHTWFRAQPPAPLLPRATEIRVAPPTSPCPLLQVRLWQLQGWPEVKVCGYWHPLFTPFSHHLTFPVFGKLSSHILIFQALWISIKMGCMVFLWFF